MSEGEKGEEKKRERKWERREGEGREGGNGGRLLWTKTEGLYTYSYSYTSNWAKPQALISVHEYFTQVRNQANWEEKVMYLYPPDIESSGDISSLVQDKLNPQVSFIPSLSVGTSSYCTLTSTQ